MTFRSGPERTESLSKTIAGMMDKPVCIVDEHCDVLLFNEEWKRFAAGSGSVSTICSVEEYMRRACERVAAGSADAATQIIEGIHSVIGGAQESCQFKYSRYMAGRERFFEGSARRLTTDGSIKVLITHGSVTTR
jgi:hypothetical protein